MSNRPRLRRPQGVGGAAGSTAHTEALGRAEAALERARAAGVDDDRLRDIFIGITRRFQAEHSAGRGRSPAAAAELLAARLNAAAARKRRGGEQQ